MSKWQKHSPRGGERWQNSWQFFTTARGRRKMRRLMDRTSTYTNVATLPASAWMTIPPTIWNEQEAHQRMNDLRKRVYERIQRKILESMSCQSQPFANATIVGESLTGLTAETPPARLIAIQYENPSLLIVDEIPYSSEQSTKDSSAGGNVSSAENEPPKSTTSPTT